VFVTLGILIAATVAVWRVPPRHRFAVWLIVILAIVLPWRSFQNHTHWDSVQWIPFVSPPIRVRDIVGNIALYVPFALFYRQQFRGSALVCIGWAFLLSLTTEASQLYSHSRFPSVQDVLMNTIGATVGVVAARYVEMHAANRDASLTRRS
jgi:glycopeptide antibiotics resistance protein